MTPYSVGAWGDSITVPANGYAPLTTGWIAMHYPKYDVSFLNQARSGNWPWSNLVRYPAELRTADADIVLCDFRPPDTGREIESAEALVRRIWTDRPGTRILSPIFPQCNDPDVDVVNDLTATEIAAQALATYYGIPLIDYRQEVIDRVAGGEHLNVYMADVIHPTAAGQALCASLVETYLQAHPEFVISPADHSSLPARQYDDGSYEREPTRLLGTDYDSISGPGWSTTGTRIESSTAGDIAQYTATCKSFGLYSAGTANSVADVQIDGGGWLLNHTISHNGYDQDIAYGPHTIEIRVRAGVAIRIDEFWAI